MSAASLPGAHPAEAVAAASLGVFGFSLPTQVRFGIGSRKSIGPAAALLGRRAVLVCGRRSFDNSPFSADILASLAAAGVQVVGRHPVGGEPTEADVEALAEVIRSNGADVVVAVGGGSVIDAAKAGAIVANMPGQLPALLAGSRVDLPIGVPVIAVPTTAGSGAEVSHGCIVNVPAERRKRGIRGAGGAARVAIVDPELVTTSDSTTTARSGFDALSHAVETSISSAASPIVRLLSAEALGRLLTSVPRSMRDPGDLEARSAASYAALLMGMNLANSSNCLPHRLQYPVGGLTGTSHAEGVAAIFPAWLERTLTTAPQRMAVLAVGARLAEPSDDVQAAAERLRDAVMAFMEEIGLSNRLGALGVRGQDIPDLIDRVEGALTNDPGPVERADLIGLYEASL